jgi:lipopolysaccharide export system permease protein
VDLFDNLGSFLDNNATVSMILRFYLYKMVWVVDIVLPIAMLMATLFTVGSLARYNELTALFSSGRSLMQITRPLLATALVTALFSMAWREYVLPTANIARTRVWDNEIHNRPDKIRPTRNIAMTGEDGRIYYARSYNPRSQRVLGLRVVSTDSAQVTERIDAAKAQWTGEHWLLENGTRRLFEEDRETVIPFAKLLATNLALTPDTLYRDRVRPEDMNIRQLSRHIELVAKSGGDPTPSAVDIQFMLAFPAIHLIVVFMGILLASGTRKTTIASGFGWTVLISFGYYFLMNFGKALGHGGTLPPVAAGWGGNLLYGIICWSLFLRARR